MTATRDTLTALTRLDIGTLILIGFMFSRVNTALDYLLLEHAPSLALAVATQAVIAGGWAWTRIQLLKARATAVNA